jgi:hypothetical protein
LLPLASGLVLLLSGASAPFSPEALWEAWPARRFVTTAAPCLRHGELAERLAALAAKHPGRLTLEAVGHSVEGRVIQLVTLGRGPRRVMLWSQMHGDEPSATPALVDLADTLLGSDSPEHRLILERLTLLLLPMLNPDGAERYARRNAQAIDINRDALELATPEGQLLKRLRARHQPELGFNLHDQDRRTTVADTGVLATIALLAVAGDPQGTLGPGRARAKRVAAAVARSLAPFVPGGISRYDEDWNPRAFGDNLTAWGTPVVLIESGGLPPGRPLGDLTRLNYVALLTALHGLAADDLAAEDAALYEGLARNSENRFVDLILEGGRMLQPPAREPYRADVALDLLDDDPLVAACADPGSPGPSRIREVGDGHLLAAARRWDATGRLIAPAFAASVRGAGARSWLSAAALDAVSRLGVARLRWHVAPAERSAALALAERLAAPGRSAIEVADLDAPAYALAIPGPPSAVASPPTVASALAALTHGAWRGTEAPTPLAESLASLTGQAKGAAPALRPEQPASLLVLRPRDADRLDASALEIEAVLLDGREAASPMAGGR